MKCISRIVPIFISLIVVASCSYLVGQVTTANSKYASPVAWTEYQIRSQKLSIALPKLPVVLNGPIYCSQTEGESYQAYARGVVYDLAVYAKSDRSIPDWCTTKTKFSVEAFTRRIGDIKASDGAQAEADATVAGLMAKVLRSVTLNGALIKTRWLIWDKKRWLELGITRRKETPVDEARFLNGLKLLSRSGTNIGSGAAATLGDADVEPQVPGEEKDRQGLIIISKPRPGYTDEARANNIQGTVVVRVIFLANGGIGEVTAVKQLQHGLTEQAIKAAKIISFLPQMVNGKPVDVAKQVEYTFSIY